MERQADQSDAASEIVEAETASSLLLRLLINRHEQSRTCIKCWQLNFELKTLLNLIQPSSYDVSQKKISSHSVCYRIDLDVSSDFVKLYSKSAVILAVTKYTPCSLKLNPIFLT